MNTYKLSRHNLYHKCPTMEPVLRHPAYLQHCSTTHNHVSLTRASPTKTVCAFKNICHVHHSHKYAIIFPDLVTAKLQANNTTYLEPHLTLYSLSSRFFISLKFRQATLKHGSILDRRMRYIFSQASSGAQPASSSMGSGSSSRRKTAEA